MILDGQPVAIRWATREKRNEPQWSKWHLTRAGEPFTACGQSIKLFEVDGSPQENPVNKITCKTCLKHLSQPR